MLEQILGIQETSREREQDHSGCKVLRRCVCIQSLVHLLGNENDNEVSTIVFVTSGARWRRGSVQC